VAVIVSLA